jgi:propionyl-CoA synthetase
VAANLMGLEPREPRAGSATMPVPGYDVRVVDASGEPMPAGSDGEIVIRLPLPPGTLPSLWRDDARFVDSYLSTHPGFYLTGDGGHVDADGYLFVMGRIDDVINVAGHRLSTGAMEQVVAAHPAVAECAVIGVDDPIKGQVPRAFVVLKAGENVTAETLRQDLTRLVRDQIGPIATLSTVDIVPALPKTRSGKILRKTMRGLAAGRDEPIPSTIDDPSALEALRPLLKP